MRLGGEDGGGGGWWVGHGGFRRIDLVGVGGREEVDGC